jgi:hypothetical protein
MQSRLHGALLVVIGLLAACSDSNSTSTSGSAPTTTAMTAVSTSAVPAPPSTFPLSVGNYNVTPLRTDGQRVVFRITTPDGATGEVSFSPPDTTIETIQPSISLIRPDGQTAGGRDIYSSRADGTFRSYCESVLGGNCTPRRTEEIRDGNRFETFARTDGGTASRVVFGPWAIFVEGRDAADSFSFHNGPDGFPLISARTTGWSTTNITLSVSTPTGRYEMQSDPTGACGPAQPRTVCDRGLSIRSFGPGPDASVRRMN